MTRFKVVAPLFLGFSLASNAFAGTWDSGTSRGFDFHSIGTESEGLKIVCDSDVERNGSFLELIIPSQLLSESGKYRVVFGLHSFEVQRSPTLILFAKKLSAQEKYDLSLAYASSPTVRVFDSDTMVLEIELGTDRPALCL
ncbi:MAG: hypothetical protein ACRBBS_12930 [Thalassovita sp.]